MYVDMCVPQVHVAHHRVRNGLGSLLLQRLTDLSRDQCCHFYLHIFGKIWDEKIGNFRIFLTFGSFVLYTCMYVPTYLRIRLCPKVFGRNGVL
jgi:hypothetical protein